MEDQPVTRAEFDGLNATAKALLDQLTAKIDNINNNNCNYNNNRNNQNSRCGTIRVHDGNNRIIDSSILSLDSLHMTKSQANDITVHDQNNKNNSSTDGIPSSDENAFVENKKDDANNNNWEFVMSTETVNEQDLEDEDIANQRRVLCANAVWKENEDFNNIKNQKWANDLTGYRHVWEACVDVRLVFKNSRVLLFSSCALFVRLAKIPLVWIMFFELDC